MSPGPYGCADCGRTQITWRHRCPHCQASGRHIWPLDAADLACFDLGGIDALKVQLRDRHPNNVSSPDYLRLYPKR